MSFAATLIDDENREAFTAPLNADVMEECDIFLGLYEEESDTACGVLCAAVVPDGDEEKERFALSVREIFIAEGFRSDQAETALLRYLQEIAALYDCSAVFVPEYVSENDKDDREALFLSLGFYREDKKLPLYEIKTSDIKVSDNKSGFGCLNIQDLSDEQWKQFAAGASDYSFEITDRGYYDPKTCIFLIDDDGNIQAGLLTGLRDGDLYVEGIAPFGGDEETLVNDLVFWERDALKKHYKNDGSVFMYMIANRSYNELLKELTDGREKRIGSLVNFTCEVPVSPEN